MTSNCTSCGAEIRWITTAARRKHPVNLPPRTVFVIEDGLGVTKKGYVSHFATCPHARTHKSKAKVVQDDLFRE